MVLPDYLRVPRAHNVSDRYNAEEVEYLTCQICSMVEDDYCNKVGCHNCAVNFIATEEKS